MARVLVTGANGFTGVHLLERLARDGHELHGLAHGGSDAHPLLTAAHAADLRDLPALADVVAQVQPDWVVHLAAIAFVAHGDAAELYSSNILGTRNLLQALSTAPRRPDALLIASSANVYGNRREGVLDESMTAEPANDYGITKLACEQLARLYGDRLPIITVRPFNYTGRGQGEQFLIPKILAHAMARQPVIELGNIDVARDFSDVRAVVDAYARLLETPAAIGGLFNVCSGEARTLAEVIALVDQISGHHMEVRVNPAFVRADEVKTLCGSRALLESVIGPLAMPPLADTIAWMLGD
ncbi:GDP-mannose 4,6 dehydratase [Sandarakinorhabdus cyanobacteriorum]|uniref:GDP-mannose 4,6 dehydratase n=1 Tax=Sandarakinorhabdus cyanobacteriorum TaxID=1981098 RepID=A0A255Y773_9SPHN|nr:NAD-dependent epimerase/dehydratase family protein [Sandarakinorhabdus cyanobacteriorum]OYQ25077.1 GDP-mannose 4,6 dehydratase [Sandarakinorhabdus cyanobacteriorum]